MLKNNKESLNDKSLLVRILIGLLLLIVFEVLSNFVLKQSLQSQADIANLINESGKQRMLIQKIALLSNQYIHDDEHSRNALKRTVERFIKAHYNLASHYRLSILPVDFSKKILIIYQKKPNNLGLLTQRYVSTVNTLLTLPPTSEKTKKLNHELYKMSQGQLFSLTDQVVLLTEKALAYNQVQITQVKNCSSILFFIFVLLEYIFLFSPLLNKIRQSFDDIVRMAITDRATGLGNRNYLLNQLDKAIKNAVITNRSFAIIYIDLDNFKNINNLHGTAIGDILIKKVAKRLISLSRSETTLVRTGGDDFVALIENIDGLSAPPLIADKFLTALNKPFTINKKKLSISVSMGIATYPQAANTINKLMSRADTALYTAKLLGKNNYVVYTKTLHKASQRKLHIENALQYAIKNNEFELFYQPQIDSRTQRVIGVEALIRWTNTDLNNPSPDEFIPISEASNHIYEISQWTLKKALLDLEDILKTCHIPTLKMSINVSGKEFFNDSFIDEKIKLLEEFKALKNNLVFELTETALITDIKNAKIPLEKLISHGVKMA